MEWAVDAGVDYIIGEGFQWGEEALFAVEVIRATGKPAVIAFAMHQDLATCEGWSLAGGRRLKDQGAPVINLNCIHGPRIMSPVLADIRQQAKGYAAALPVPIGHTTTSRPSNPCKTQSMATVPTNDHFRPHSIPLPAPVTRAPILRQTRRRWISGLDVCYGAARITLAAWSRPWAALHRPAGTPPSRRGTRFSAPIPA